MSYDKKNMIVSFHQESNVDPVRILKLAREKWPALRLTRDLQLYIPLPDLQENDILREARGILKQLTRT